MGVRLTGGKDEVSNRLLPPKEQRPRLDHSLIISDKVIDIGNRKRGKLARFDPDPDLWGFEKEAVR